MRKASEEKERVSFRASLPMEETKFPPFFDFLDQQLGEYGCGHDLSLVGKYCTKNNLDFVTLSKWCEKYGGYCDCEVLANVEDEFYYLNKIVPTKTVQKMKTAQREKLNELSTDFGFAIKQVPSPWVLLSITEKDEIKYLFQIGKKSDFPIFLKDDFPIEKLGEDDFLQDYWVKKTDLENELDFTIERQALIGFEIVQVSTEKWMPIFLFISRLDSKWCLVMETTTIRVRNDMKELERLLKEIIV